MLNMLRSIGTTELLVLAAILIFLFGGKKIPELFKGMAEAVREFKKASNDTPKKKDDN